MADTSKLNVIPCFAAPIVQLFLPDPGRLNAELQTLFLERERQGARYKNPVPTPTVQVEIFESEFDLFKWPQACVQRLKQFCLGNLMRVVAELNGYGQAELERLVIYDDTWFHVTRYGGYIAAHNHPNASWSGVYCVTPGERPADRPDSGILRFHDLRPACVMYMDAGNAHLRRPYGNGAIGFPLQPGELILFPSYLMHEVAPFFGSDERITVAFNAWVRQKSA